MSQLVPDPSLLLIEDRLDAIGQKYRVQRIVRGAMLWIAGALMASSDRGAGAPRHAAAHGFG